MTTNRDFDLVLWGATGFTGTLTAEYLAEHAQISDLDWAIAGRNRDKLEQLRTSLGEDHADLPILVGDALDRASLDDIATRTKVVCSTCGPYAKLGSDLVAACVQTGTDYCDLTGEVHWVREMIDAHHQTARDNNARIVHCCGFDSVPSDLGTLLVQNEAIDRFGAPCEQVLCFIWHLRGGISGGTAASAAGVIAAARKDAQVRKTVTDPYGLNPPDNRPGIDGPPQQKPRFEPAVDGWSAPFVMATVNEKVVRRTNALLDDRYGNQFSYREASYMGRGASAAAKATMMSASLGAITAGLALRPTRKLIEKLVFPDPGEGPDRDTIENGRFTLRFHGKNPGGEDRGHDIVCEVAADQDPGYGATAVMLAESALCLAVDDADGLDGGVLTPASALGTTLIDRLRNAGLTFDVLE